MTVSEADPAGIVSLSAKELLYLNRAALLKSSYYLSTACNISISAKSARQIIIDTQGLGKNATVRFSPKHRIWFRDEVAMESGEAPINGLLTIIERIAQQVGIAIQAQVTACRFLQVAGADPVISVSLKPI